MQPCAARIDRLVASLEATHGGLRIADLARQFGLSRRQVERAFIDDVGLAPKVFASIQRFSYAAAQLRAGCPIAEAAFAAGYADQSHLHLDFRRYAHLTPARYARGDVAFLQDSKQPIEEDGGAALMKESSS